MKYIYELIIVVILTIVLIALAYTNSFGQTVTTNICEAPATSCEWKYDVGTAVILEAEPEKDSYFVGWAGDKCYGTNPICKFNMPKGNLLAYAIFDLLPTENLYVFVYGKDGGRVVSNPAGIDCKMGMCEAKFPKNTVVTLTATALNGFTWRGLYCSGTGTCTTTMKTGRVINVRIK